MGMAAFSRVAILGLAVFFCAAQAGAEDDFSVGAKDFISSLGDRVIEELTGADLDREERVQRFRRILHDHFAVQAIGQWVLGRNWNSASEDQRKRYMELFEDLIVATYVNRFENYKGETFSINTSDMRSEKDAIVASQINQVDGSPPLKVEWRVRKQPSDGQFKIVDVIVEGISMGQTQRSDFASVLREKGGSMDGFLEALGQRVEKAGQTTEKART